MRIIIMAAVALLVLGGGGAGAYFYLNQSAQAAADATDEHGAEKTEHEQAKHDDGHGSGGHGEYVELDPLILPIVDKNGVSQVVSIVVALEVADSHAASEVTRLTPKIKDAFIQDMYGMLNKHAALKGGVIQVGVLKKRLNKVSAEVLGEDMVQDVLLQVVQQRPI